MNKFVLALLSSAMLSSCTMMPDYSRPESPVNSEWPQGKAYIDLSSTERASIKQVSWQEFFQSPQLQKIIQATLDNNRDLRVAALNIQIAREQYRIQRADLVPTIDALGAANRQNIPENLAGIQGEGVTSQYSANIGTTAYEIDLFGRMRSLNKQALEEYFATEEARNATQIALIAEVANAYLVYLSDEKLLRLTQETLTAQQSSYDLINKTFELGVGNKLDVSQAAQSVETARTNYSIYLRRMEQDKNALLLLMGVSSEGNLLQGETLDNIQLKEELPVGLPSDVLLERPDIRQAEHDLIAANANIGAARAAFFPTITLTGSAGVASSSLDNLFQADSVLAWTFAPQISIPIFEGGRNLANLGVSQATRDIRVAQYEKSIQVAFREVSDELAARGTYTEQLKSQQALVEAAENSYNLSKARYDQGIENYLNVLDAQRSMYAAQQNEIIVQQERLSNLVNLYKVLGGGLNEGNQKEN